jgi:hypothetical protein
MLSGSSFFHEDVYSYNFPEDSRRLKLLGAQNFPSLLSLSTPDSCYIVCAVFVLETVQTVLTGADVYYWFASGYGDLNRLATPFASAIDIPIMGSIVSAMVQFFYAYRVWIVSNKKWWLFTFICLVSRSQAIIGVSYSVPSFYAVLLCQRSSSIQYRYSCSCFPLFSRWSHWLTVADASTSKVLHQ